MSMELWDEMKCDACPIKDDHRCVECRHFETDPASTWGYCKKNLYATRETDKACDDFEERDE